jgi:class 3 adenylate cyclase
MSRDVVDAAGVGDLLARFAVTQQDILLKGIDRPVVVFRAGSRRPDL